MEGTGTGARVGVCAGVRAGVGSAGSVGRGGRAGKVKGWLSGHSWTFPDSNLED